MRRSLRRCTTKELKEGDEVEWERHGPKAAGNHERDALKHHS